MEPVVERCAGGILLDEQRRLLMIRRAQAPSAGLWSIPGGRCLPGEDSATACMREVAEETGLQVTINHLAGQVELEAPSGTYLVDDYVCELVGGVLQAGDDATEARWVSRAELLALATAPGLYEALLGWDALPD